VVWQSQSHGACWYGPLRLLSFQEA